MLKNGLFLMSIGLLIFVYSANAKTGVYDFLSIITAASFFGAGLFFFLKGRKREKQEQQTEVKENGNR